MVYGELHRLAKHYMAAEREGHTLQTTALVHEAYLRLIDTSQVNWRNRAHFFAVAAQLMRRILVDFARSRRSHKRGGAIGPASLDEAAILSAGRSPELVALDDALNALATIDPRKSQIVELRFFGGLSAQETAEVLRISTDTVMRDWKLAKMWLLRELSAENQNAG